MSFCKEEGKDRIIFVTEEDHKSPSSVQLPEDEERAPGLVKENGELNWNCPCLGGMATGPCGVEFRDAFTCFHYSDADPKGSDCLESFKKMSMCMSDYPGVYGSRDDNVMSVSEEDNGIDDTPRTKSDDVDTPVSNTDSKTGQSKS